MHNFIECFKVLAAVWMRHLFFSAVTLRHWALGSRRFETIKLRWFGCVTKKTELMWIAMKKSTFSSPTSSVLSAWIQNTLSGLVRFGAFTCRWWTSRRVRSFFAKICKSQISSAKQGLDWTYTVPQYQQNEKHPLLYTKGLLNDHSRNSKSLGANRR